ncbi:MAG: Uma2 family endonuclease [Polyangiaceae bacterium]
MKPGEGAAVYANLLALSEDERAEIADGRIVFLPPPLPEHGFLQVALGALVGGPFQLDHGRGGPGGWWILSEVDLQLSEHRVVRPDLAGWRRERLPGPWGNRPIRVVPDWICEVLSPSKPAHDRVWKRRIYAQHRVEHYWIADPAARTLEALRLDRESGQWHETGAFDDDSVARIAPFEAVELAVGRLFPPVPAER